MPMYAAHLIASPSACQPACQPVIRTARQRISTLRSTHSTTVYSTQHRAQARCTPIHPLTQTTQPTIHTYIHPHTHTHRHAPNPTQCLTCTAHAPPSQHPYSVPPSPHPKQPAYLPRFRTTTRPHRSAQLPSPGPEHQDARDGWPCSSLLSACMDGWT
ncbi:uncharacterized protein K452DRAFT_9615 [Aplosporella prunicola CBS 121167]|uniref:Uncharacterized protein n=1 Tax=Aplosporella prunicola CBS 121167 TaxID=1176127 RepID=A0A6A6BF68_9PEZI|nr:uncharacterized protein K452DRAFT_9615 [Aplosporella prunicola CBS 121167]KAF2142716.1 hypothetical protein K452DRAFT_9615 [Aplosporella prunicola CBS 121167]